MAEPSWDIVRAQSGFILPALRPFLDSLAADAEFITSVGTSSRILRMAIIEIFLFTPERDAGAEAVAYANTCRGTVALLICTFGTTKGRDRAVKMLTALQQRRAAAPEAHATYPAITDLMVSEAIRIASRTLERSKNMGPNSLPAVSHYPQAFPEVVLYFRADCPALLQNFFSVEGLEVPDFLVCPEVLQLWWDQGSIGLAKALDKSFWDNKARDRATGRPIGQNQTITDQKSQDEYGFREAKDLRALVATPPLADGTGNYAPMQPLPSKFPKPAAEEQGDFDLRCLAWKTDRNDRAVQMAATFRAWILECGAPVQHGLGEAPGRLVMAAFCKVIP